MPTWSRRTAVYVLSSQASCPSQSVGKNKAKLSLCMAVKSRLPHVLSNRLTDGGEVVSLTRQPPFTWYSVLLEAESTQGHSVAVRIR
jgi:hypothetical protein